MYATKSQLLAWNVGRAIAAFNASDGVYAYPTAHSAPHAQSFEQLVNALGSRSLAVAYVELGGRAASYADQAKRFR